MTDGIVGWAFFDAESGTIPDGIQPSLLPEGGAGRIVVLAATPFARAEGWASRAVVAIARAWAGDDLRIFLMDLGLDAPSLHEAMDLPNMEGVSDAFLYGASVQRIAQPALDDSIFFAPSGTATTEPEQILAHPRWNDLAGGFSEADATLLLFLPTGLAGGEKILSRATDILFLSGEGESPEEFLGPASVKVLGSCGPAGAPPLEGAGIVIDPVIGEGTDDLMPDTEERFTPAANLLLSDKPAVPEDLGTVLEETVPEGTFSLADAFTAETVGVQPQEAEAAGEPEDPVLADEPGMPGEFALEELESGGGGLSDQAHQESQDQDESDGDIPDFGAQGIPSKEIPDFGAEFAAMPDLEGSGEEGFSGDGSPGLGDPVSGSAYQETESTGPLGPPDPHDFMAMDEPASDEEVEPDPGGSPPLDRARYEKLRNRPRLRPPPPKRRMPWIPILGSLAALVIVAAGGTAFGLFQAPGFGWLSGPEGRAPAIEISTPDVVPLEEVLQFSLELESYEADERGIAVDMRNALRNRLPGLLFHLSPQASGGTVTYVLHAGPASDVVEAENLRAPLEETLIREDPEGWSVRETPLAFLLGTRSSLAEAEAFLASVEVAGGLGYIVRVTLPDSTEGYEILSGAFQTAEDARWLQSSLQDAGFRELPLIQRRGRPPE